MNWLPSNSASLYLCTSVPPLSQEESAAAERSPYAFKLLF